MLNKPDTGKIDALPSMAAPVAACVLRAIDSSKYPEAPLYERMKDQGDFNRAVGIVEDLGLDIHALTNDGLLMVLQESGSSKAHEALSLIIGLARTAQSF